MKTSIFNKSALLFFYLFFLIAPVLFLKINVACSQTQTATADPPLHVLSDKMIAIKDSSMVEFVGNVKASWKDSIILADSIKIYFILDNKDKKNIAGGNIKQIIAVGNVRYTAGKRKAFADKAVYTAMDDVLILTGKAPKLITGSSFVTGKKITLFRKQDKAVVESDNTKRVEAFFNPEDNISDNQ